MQGFPSAIFVKRGDLPGVKEVTGLIAYFLYFNVSLKIFYSIRSCVWLVEMCLILVFVFGFLQVIGTVPQNDILYGFGEINFMQALRDKFSNLLAIHDTVIYRIFLAFI